MASTKEDCRSTWPSIIPNLNPIENLWSELKIRISRQPPKNIQELEQVAME